MGGGPGPPALWAAVPAVGHGRGGGSSARHLSPEPCSPLRGGRPQFTRLRGATEPAGGTSCHHVFSLASSTPSWCGVAEGWGACGVSQGFWAQRPLGGRSPRFPERFPRPPAPPVLCRHLWSPAPLDLQDCQVRAPRPGGEPGGPSEGRWTPQGLVHGFAGSDRGPEWTPSSHSLAAHNSDPAPCRMGEARPPGAGPPGAAPGRATEHQLV